MAMRYIIIRSRRFLLFSFLRPPNPIALPLSLLLCPKSTYGPPTEWPSGRMGGRRTYSERRGISPTTTPPVSFMRPGIAFLTRMGECHARTLVRGEEGTCLPSFQARDEVLPCGGGGGGGGSEGEGTEVAHESLMWATCRTRTCIEIQQTGFVFSARYPFYLPLQYFFPYSIALSFLSFCRK